MGSRIEVTITYLEQSAPPTMPLPPAPPFRTALMRAENPPLHFYRYLYRLVGDPWNWVSRRRMNDEDLKTIIGDKNVYFYVLYVEGVPAGMAEIDARASDHHELKFFGLAPEFTGRRLGKYFLLHVLDLVWARAPKRVVLETCTLDHKAALPLYQKVGFHVFDRREGIVELMDDAEN